MAGSGWRSRPLDWGTQITAVVKELIERLERLCISVFNSIDE